MFRYYIFIYNKYIIFKKNNIHIYNECIIFIYNIERDSYELSLSSCNK